MAGSCVKILIISDDIYRPALVREEVTQPYLMEVDVLKVDGAVVELYQVSSQIQNKHYLDLYQNVISSVDIIVFHFKEKTSKGGEFRNWLKVIPISVDLRVVFVLETNVSTVMENFRERLRGYWRKEVEGSVIWLNSTVDRSGVLKRVLEGREGLIRMRDYMAESDTISQVKSFFKFRGKRSGVEDGARSGSVV